MNDQYYLQLASKLAEKSKEPIKCACLLVNKNGDIISQEFNSQRTDNLTIAHAEIKSITKANKLVGRKLTGLTAYGNCEPCTMCLTALIFAGVDKIVFSKKLNDLVKTDKRISIDCFEFVKNFPHQPEIVFYNY